MTDILSIASGKGGTGKTTVSVNLALAAAKLVPTILLDCDVEEPNCGLFLDLGDWNGENALSPSFEADKEKCDACGACAAACRFNAIAALGSAPIFFHELCHGCGGCALACPNGAIIENKRRTGVIREASKGNLTCVDGLLDIGQAMAPPVIRQLRKKKRSGAFNIIDSPPGTSCAMLAAVRDCDFTLLVTEPTPFGLNDLKLAVAAMREMESPFAVVVNRDGIGDDRVEKYCETENIELAATIPDERHIAELYSRGLPAYGRVDSVTKIMDELAERFAGEPE